MPKDNKSIGNAIPVTTDPRFKNIVPDEDKLLPGRHVYVKWSNGQSYVGVLIKKRRKYYSVTIIDDKWHYSCDRVAVPIWALVPCNYIGAPRHAEEEVATRYSKKLN